MDPKDKEDASKRVDALVTQVEAELAGQHRKDGSIREVVLVFLALQKIKEHPHHEKPATGR